MREELEHIKPTNNNLRRYNCYKIEKKWVRCHCLGTFDPFTLNQKYDMIISQVLFIVQIIVYN